MRARECVSVVVYDGQGFLADQAKQKAVLNAQHKKGDIVYIDGLLPAEKGVPIDTPAGVRSSEDLKQKLQADGYVADGFIASDAQGAPTAGWMVAIDRRLVGAFDTTKGRTAVVGEPGVQTHVQAGVGGRFFQMVVQQFGATASGRGAVAQGLIARHQEVFNAPKPLLLIGDTVPRQAGEFHVPLMLRRLQIQRSAGDLGVAIQRGARNEAERIIGGLLPSLTDPLQDPAGQLLRAGELHACPAEQLVAVMGQYAMVSSLEHPGTITGAQPTVKALGMVGLAGCVMAKGAEVGNPRFVQPLYKGGAPGIQLDVVLTVPETMATANWPTSF